VGRAENAMLRRRSKSSTVIAGGAPRPPDANRALRHLVGVGLRPARIDMTAAPSRSFFRIELVQGVSIGNVFVMLAALISLFVDQSFGSVFQSIQNYVGGSLGASADELPWTSIGFNTFYWVMILLTPWLIDRFGRKVVFGVGHLTFGFLTLLLAVTTSLSAFNVGRCFQGMAQGTFFVCAVATVLTLFPPRLRGIAFSFFSVVSLSGVAAGPFIGGWFLDHAHWRDAFVLYALLAVFAGTVIFALLEAPGRRWTGRFDVPGIAFAFLAFFCFEYASSFGERRDWLPSPDIVWSCLLSAVGFAGFIWRELCEDRCGFIQLRLFNIRNLAVGSVLGFGLGVPLYGANLFLQYAQTSLALPPSTAGALLTLRIPAILIVAPLVVMLVNSDRLDVRVPVTIGFLLVPLSYALLAIQTTSGSDFTTFVFALIISGAAFACLFSPIANVLVRSLSTDVRAEGIAIFKMVLLLGGSVAATGLVVIFDHSAAWFQSLLASDATLRRLVPLGFVPPVLTLASLVQQEAAVLAYADNSKVVALLSLLNLPLIFLLRKPGVAIVSPPPEAKE
jgi:MFS transporter, DHA2 family, multidrug resistance protein